MLTPNQSLDIAKAWQNAALRLASARLDLVCHTFKLATNVLPGTPRPTAGVEVKPVKPAGEKTPIKPAAAPGTAASNIEISSAAQAKPAKAEPAAQPGSAAPARTAKTPMARVRPTTGMKSAPVPGPRRLTATPPKT
ncbi:MAG: hypothetical protein GDA53_02160 [Rhodobacteraceae bacterium]|nr:hypothetical protein [Paracoccaceae bacterium]